MSLDHHFFIDPIGKPRMTQRDRWKQRPCVMRYRAFCDKLRAEFTQAHISLPDAFEIQFTIEMPASWSQKKRNKMCGRPHQSRPDLDNMLKAVCDAASKEDSTVHAVAATKVWGKCGMISIGEFYA